MTLNARWSSYWKCFLYFLPPTPTITVSNVRKHRKCQKKFPSSPFLLASPSPHTLMWVLQPLFMKNQALTLHFSEAKFILCLTGAGPSSTCSTGPNQLLSKSEYVFHKQHAQTWLPSREITLLGSSFFIHRKIIFTYVCYYQNTKSLLFLLFSPYIARSKYITTL